MALPHRLPEIASHVSAIASPLEKLRVEELVEHRSTRPLIEHPQAPHLIECQSQSRHLPVFRLNPGDGRIIESHAGVVVVSVLSASCTHASGNRNNGTGGKSCSEEGRSWDYKVRSVSICDGHFIL